MRFVWAVAAFVLAALMIGLGIAQRTVFQEARSETAKITTSQSAPFTVVDSAVLRSHPGAQTVKASGDGPVFLSYARTTDIDAWLRGTAFNRVALGPDGLPVTTYVAASTVGAEAGTVSHNPVGSDLWLDEVRQDGSLSTNLLLPEGMSVLIASDGTAPAPATVSIDWPLSSATPWSGPLIVGGTILMVVGLGLYVLGIRHARRSRGPRRKAPPPLPPTEPIDLAIDGADKGVVAASPRRRSITGRRSFAVVPVVLVSALAFTGCSPDAWPQFGATATPTPTTTLIVPENQQQPAVTQAQAATIIARISETAAAADAAKDVDLAATRLGGAALAVRKTNYTLRNAIADYAAPAAIPTDPIEIILPEAFDSWPRTVLAVVRTGADLTIPPSIMYLTQADPWSEYKLDYIGDLEASAALPDLAPAYVGTARIPPNTEFLLLPPSELAGAYADVLNNGDNSPHAALFDADTDLLRASVAADRQKRLDDFNKTASTTGTLTFEASAGTEAPIGLATVESGAIVAVSVRETDIVKPTNADAVIKFDSNPTVKAMTGVDQSATGVTTTFADQLFFYVPAQGSSEKIRLLGYSGQFLDAKVIS